MPIYVNNEWKKTPADIKRKSIYYAKKHSTAEAAAKYNLSCSVINNWLKAENTEVRLTKKNKAIAVYFLSHSVDETCKHFNIAHNRALLVKIFNIFYNFNRQEILNAKNNVRIKNIVNYFMTHSGKETEAKFNVSSVMIRRYVKQVFNKSRDQVLYSNLAVLVAWKFKAYAYDFFKQWKIVDLSPIKDKEDNKEVICKHCGYHWHVCSHTIKKYADHCPNCNISVYSSGEREIMTYLSLNNIKYFAQYHIVINNRNHYYDFYLPEKKMFIEYNGMQHYETVPYFQNYQSHRTLSLQKFLDNEKKNYALKHNCQFLAIPGNKKQTEKMSKIAKILDQQFGLKTKLSALRDEYQILAKENGLEISGIDIARYSQDNTIKETMAHFNVSKGIVENCRKSFLTKNDYNHIKLNRSVVAKKDNKIINFDSVKEAAKHFNCAPKVIYKIINNGRPNVMKNSTARGFLIQYSN